MKKRLFSFDTDAMPNAFDIVVGEDSAVDPSSLMVASRPGMSARWSIAQ